MFLREYVTNKGTVANKGSFDGDLRYQCITDSQETDIIVYQTSLGTNQHIMFMLCNLDSHKVRLVEKLKSTETF